MQANFRPDIEGLRAIAVMAVLLYHLELGCPGGYVGVDVFFVISGFLITQMLTRQIDGQRFSFATFWERRVRRLLPALAVMLALTTVAGWWILLPAHFDDLGKTLISQPLLCSNVLFWRSIPGGYFNDPAEHRPTLHTWSLAVEEQFYLFYPFLLFALLRFAPRRAVTPLLAAFAAASFLLSGLLTPHKSVLAFFLLPTRAWELLLGALVARVDLPERARLGFGLLGGTFIVGSMIGFNHQTVFPGWAAALPCLGTALVIWAQPSAGLLVAAPTRFIGQISYSLYLWHWPLYAYALYLAGSLTLAQRLALLVASLVAGALSWKFVETPFREQRLLAAKPRLWLAAGLCALAMLGAGTLMHVFNGFPERYPPSGRRYEVAKADRSPRLEIDDAMARRHDFAPLGSPTGDISFVLWGDSHAMAMAPALNQVARRYGLKGVQATRAGTPPLLPAAQQTGPLAKADSAQVLAPSVLEYTREHKVPFVLMAAYWNRYPAAEIADRLSTTLAAIEAAGAVPVFIRDVPELPCDLPVYLDSRARYPWLPAVEVTLQQHRAKEAELLECLKRQSSKKLIVLEQSAYLVDERGVLLLEKNGRVNFYDRDHLTISGAQQLIPMFEQLARTMAGR